MRIGLINEDSQAEKNGLIFNELLNSSFKFGHKAYNYGMFKEDDEHQINYTQVGILASVLLGTEMVDFVVTGCGTGQGAMLSCNAFANVACGYADSPLDAYLFSQINSGNCISIPFAQQFGWGSELNLAFIFDALFGNEFGGGYPKKFAGEESISRKRMFTGIKSKSQYPLLEALKRVDQQELYELLNYREFIEDFNNSAKNNEITEFIRILLNIK